MSWVDMYDAKDFEPKSKEKTITIELPKGIELKEFKTCAYYHTEMDQLTFVTEDVSYTSENNSDSLIQVLWHPYENRPVGFNIECPMEFIKRYIEERNDVER